MTIWTGTNGANTYNGTFEADYIDGLGGNDTFYVNNSGVTVNENSGGGTDMAISSVDYALTSNVENLTLAGTGNIAGTGNTLANSIYGNAGNNALDGGNGADTLNGGSGSDFLTGGADADLFVFQTGTNWDTVTDFAAGAAGDVASVASYGFADFAAIQAAMTQSGADVVLALNASDQVTFQNTLLASFDSSNFVW